VQPPLKNGSPTLHAPRGVAAVPSRPSRARFLGGVLAATVGRGFQHRGHQGVLGDATLPMFAMVDVPVWASVFAVLVVPVLTELAEPVAYLGGLLPFFGREFRPVLTGCCGSGRYLGRRARVRTVPDDRWRP
jgi:hypothetical protein